MEKKSHYAALLFLMMCLLAALSLQWQVFSHEKSVLLDDTEVSLYCSAEAVPALQGKFTDLTPKHWAYDAVEKLASQGVIDGFPDGSFQPEEPLRYGEFIKLILASQESTPAGSAPASQDISKIHWAFNYYILALEQGFFTIHDISKGQLDQQIPRGVMALLASSALEEKPVIAGLNTFQDVTGSTPYEYDIERSHAMGILEGFEDGSFRPDQGLTRAEGAVVIQRLMALKETVEPTRDINQILSYEELKKIISLGPITDYVILPDSAGFDLSVRDSRYGGQKILSIRTRESVCFLAEDAATGRMHVLEKMTAGHSQYPSDSGITARYFIGDLSAVDYFAISPAYQFGATEGTLTLIRNPYRSTAV